MSAGLSAMPPLVTGDVMPVLDLPGSAGPVGGMRMTTKGLRRRLRRRHSKTEGILKQVRSWSSAEEDGAANAAQNAKETRRLDGQEPGPKRELKDPESS